MFGSNFRFAIIAGIVVVSSTASLCGGAASDEDAIPLPETKPFSAEQETAIYEIRDAAMFIRGLNVSSEINEGTLTREEIRAYYESIDSELTDEDRAEIEVYNTAFRMLRIFGPEDDLFDLYTDFWGDSSAGFYALDEDKLVLIGDGLNLSYEDKSTLAHEYIHSFQDAAFDLDAWDKLHEKESDNEDGAPTEYGTTTDCLLEGDASLTETIYAQQVLGPEPEEDPAVDAGNPPAAEDDGPDTPPGFLRYMVFNYNECPLWALALWADAGGKFDKINEAYARPPWTTEQIMHPEKYLQREGVTSMPPLDLRDRLGDGWERATSGIFGEFDVYNYVATVLDDEAAGASAASGWGVGWIGLYTSEGEEDVADDDSTVVYVSLEFDNAAEFNEFAVIYGAVIEKLGGASVTRAPDGSAACWNGAVERAYVGVNPARNRIDIVMATDDASLKLAASDPLSSASTGKCPGWEQATAP